MIDIQEAVVEHFKTVKNTYGIKTVKPYEGEFADAEKSIAKLNSLKPAVFVVMNESDVYPHTEQGQCDLYIVAENRAYKTDKARKSAMQLAGYLADWLLDNSDETHGNLVWVYDGNNYAIDFGFDEPLKIQTMAITDKLAIVRMGFMARLV